MFFLVNDDNEHAKSLRAKMADNPKPGKVIHITEDEMEYYRSGASHILFPSKRADVWELIDLLKSWGWDIEIRSAPTNTEASK